LFPSLAADPDPVRVAQLEHNFRLRLATSLEQVVTTCSAFLDLDLELFRLLGDRIRAAPVSSQVVALYADLVLAIEAEDLEAAQSTLDALGGMAEAIPVPSGSLPRLVPFGDPLKDPVARRFARYFDTDQNHSLTLHPPTSQQLEHISTAMAETFELLDQADPSQSAELKLLLQEIVLVNGGTEAWDFDGASSFLLFGAILINVRHVGDRLDLAQLLVHESGHNLLFGFCADGPLLENDDRDLFESPLRTDLRPLDGILHACFVLVRMHALLRRLLSADVLNPYERDKAERNMLSNREACRSSLATVTHHARLTSRGEAVVAGVKAELSIFSQ
jgi:hypothetical protein